MELVYGSRIILIFSTATITASLTSHIFAPSVVLTGSDSGNLAIMCALVITWTVNSRPSCGMWTKIMVVIALSSAVLGVALFRLEMDAARVTFWQPLAGIFSGATTGVAAFGFEQRLKEQRKWWLVVTLQAAALVFLCVYVALGMNKRVIY